MNWGLRDDRSRPEGRQQSVGAVPVAARAGGSRFLRDGDAGGDAAIAGRNQALVDQSHGNPRRLTVGLEAQRLAMLLAVLHRHAEIVCFDQDVFVNAVGGVPITEPAADLAVLMAIISSLKTNRCLTNLLYLVKLVWPGRSDRRRVERSA